MGEAEDEEEHWEKSPGHGMAVVLINSKELWLPTQAGACQHPIAGYDGVPRDPTPP